MGKSSTQWKQIPNYPDYVISTDGQVYNQRTNNYLSVSNHNGVSLKNENGFRPYSIQLLMGCTFLGNDINDPFRNRVLFKDKNTSNLSLSNLYVEDTSDLLGEKWAPIQEFNGNIMRDYYRVSNKGRVKSLRHTENVIYRGKETVKYYPEMIITPATIMGGYQQVALYSITKKQISIPVHRIVAFAFCKNNDPQVDVFVNHIDGCTSNNCAENLEWCTPAENVQHAYRTGLMDNVYHERLRYPVIRLETNVLYESLSAAAKAMGRHPGYIHMRMKQNKPCTSITGEVWTFSIHKDWKQERREEGKQCYFEEIPGTVFISMLLASQAIGRNNVYIADRVYMGKEIHHKDGRALHLHFVDPELERQYQSGEMVPDKYKARIGRTDNGCGIECYLEECPDLKFESYAALSRYLGKADGYVGEAVTHGGILKDPSKKLVHLHFVDPEMERKYQAGELIKPKYRKESKSSSFDKFLKK